MVRSEFHEQTMRSIADAVRSGKCILFLGAGINAPDTASPSKYEAPQCPPFAKDLALRLADQADYWTRFPPEGQAPGKIALDLRRVALDFELHNTRRELVDELRLAVHRNKQPSPLLHQLAKLPFPLIITTNYDQLLETALHQAGKQPVLSIYKRNEGRVREATDDYPEDSPSAQMPFVFKIHGDIDRPDSIVITEDDYIQFVLRMGDSHDTYPIPKTMEYHLMKWPILFIGYGLMDYNLRLLFKTLRWKLDPSGMPTSYSVDFKPDPLVLKVLGDRYLKYVVADIWSFIPDLSTRVLGGGPS